MRVSIAREKQVVEEKLYSIQFTDTELVAVLGALTQAVKDQPVSITASGRAFIHKAIDDLQLARRE